MNLRPHLISLCMIVRNEEENISFCLDSVKDIADEIVIVDTGSEDNTLKIVEKYGAIVYKIAWKDDFSDARNYCLSKAGGLWVLVLDADEVLDESARHTLRKTLTIAAEEGFYISIKNYKTSNSNSYTKTYALRVFRNKSEYRYEGRIHEQIFPSIKRASPQGCIGWSPWVLHHYGYSKDAVKVKDKARRNLAILFSETPEVKESAFFCLNLAMEYLRLRNLFQAEFWLKKGWGKVDKRDSYAHLLLNKLVVCLHLQKKDEEALLYCREGLKIYPDYPDMYYQCGICLMETGDCNEARKILSKGLEQKKSLSIYVCESGCGSYLNYFALGQIEERCGNIELALDNYLKAVKIAPKHLLYFKSLLRVLFKSNLDKNFYLEENNLFSKDSLFYSWIYAVIARDYISAKRFSVLLKDYDKKLNLLTEELLEFIINASYSADQSATTKSGRPIRQSANNYLCSEENIVNILKIIDEFAAQQKTEHLKPVIDFLLSLTGDDFKPLILTILHRRKCWNNALNLLQTINLQKLDDQERRIVIEVIEHFGKEVPPIC